MKRKGFTLIELLVVAPYPIFRPRVAKFKVGICGSLFCDVRALAALPGHAFA